VENDGPYVLATGSSAISRLRLLDGIFGADSRELLKRVGLSPGSRVGDIGCGTGLMALWMARQVTETGEVWAVDSSREQLRVAEQDSRAAGLSNLRFQEASVYNTALSRESLDFAYSRFLMCHLTKPADAMKEMRGMLKTGGMLVCEDYQIASVGTYPPSAAYVRLADISARVDAQRGVDSNIGVKLHSLFLETGFSHPEVTIRQPAFLRGDVKRFWEVTLREAAPAIVKCGAATAKELEELFTALRTIADDDKTLLLVARVFQVWARK
jgi:ubiquinone/menaquinone biosynthesis C-methylase UbiE